MKGWKQRLCVSPAAGIHDQWDLSYHIQQHNVSQGHCLFFFFLQWLRVMSEKTYFFDCLPYSHLTGTKITHSQVDVPAWGSLNGCCDFSNVFSSTFAVRTHCVGFSVTHTGVLRIISCQWVHSLDLCVLFFLVSNSPKISLRVINRVFQASFTSPGPKGRSLLHRISERMEKLWLLIAHYSKFTANWQQHFKEQLAILTATGESVENLLESPKKWEMRIRMRSWCGYSREGWGWSTGMREASRWIREAFYPPFYGNTKRRQRRVLGLHSEGSRGKGHPFQLWKLTLDFRKFIFPSAQEQRLRRLGAESQTLENFWTPELPEKETGLRSMASDWKRID